jgi:hypothetical protein
MKALAQCLTLFDSHAGELLQVKILAGNKFTRF